MTDWVISLGINASSGLGEGYSEYVGMLSQACLRLCDRNNHEVLRALATVPYNHDGAYALTLAREHGSEVTEIMFEQTGSTNPVVRRSAVRCWEHCL